MSEPFLADVKLFGFNFAPRGWALCDGQILPINQNQSLFPLLGTTCGGDGQVTFGLPDLRGRVPIHVGNGLPLGQMSGTENHTLVTTEMPKHTHPAMASSSNADAPLPARFVLAAANNVYGSPKSLTPLHEDTVKSTGGGQAHANMQPFTTLNFAIALTGLFPSRN